METGDKFVVLPLAKVACCFGLLARLLADASGDICP